MSRDTRWAARYQFLEECWRGQDRVVIDAGLERALLGGGLDDALLGHDPVAQLLDILLPSRSSDGQAWVVLQNDRRAGELARIRPNAQFVSLSDAVSVASEEPWRLAMVDLDGALRPPADGASTLSSRIEPAVLAAVEALGERANGRGGPVRMVALSAPVTPRADLEPDAGLDAAVEEFAELVEEVLPGARIYGIAWPTMATVYNLAGGEDAAQADPLAAYDAELDAAEAEWTDEDETQIFDAPGDDLAIDYDNTRADPVPRFSSLLAVFGPDVVLDGLGQGVTLLELPAAADDTAAAVAESASPLAAPGRELAELRTQLGEAKHQAQVLAVERQRLLEELDETRERLESAEDHEGGRASSTADRLDMALAQRQQLRWELDRARERITELEGRPVTELEADNARLRAELAGMALSSDEDLSVDEGRGAPADDDGGDDELAPAATEAPTRETTGRGTSRETDSPRETRTTSDHQPQSSRHRLREVVAGQLDRLLRRVERGGISSLELHRALKTLKQSLPRL